MNNYTVFKQRVAGYLMMRGFVLVGVEQRRNMQTGKNVFFFQDSPELRNAIKEYSSYSLVKPD